MKRSGDVEKGFVAGKRLNVWGEVSEDLHDLGGDFLIARHADGQEDGVRAAFRRRARGHSGVDSKFSRFVGASGNDPALVARRADDERQPLQIGIVVHFDRREKGVHIDVKYGSFGH